MFVNISQCTNYPVLVWTWFYRYIPNVNSIQMVYQIYTKGTANVIQKS